MEKPPIYPKGITGDRVLTQAPGVIPPGLHPECWHFFLMNIHDSPDPETMAPRKKYSGRLQLIPNLTTKL